MAPLNTSQNPGFADELIRKAQRILEPMFELWPHQIGSINSIYNIFSSGYKGNCLIVIPTGCGKSGVIAGFSQRALAEFPGTKIIILTHVRELIQQDYNAIKRLWPEAPCGIYSAGLKKRELGFPITFAGIQSIYKRAHEVVHVDLVVVDEAHRIGRVAGTMYGRFFHQLKTFNPKVKIIGLTATPFRLDSGLLVEGKDRLFDAVAYEAPLLDMIEKGFACQIVSKPVRTEFDVEGVGTRGGDFIAGQLEAAVDKDPITRAAVAEVVAFGIDRRSWLLFCSGIQHAQHVRDAVRAHGIECEMVTGATPAAERDRILQAFKSGELRAVTNCNVLTTGFDHPGLDLIALLRPTKSVALYVQMLGRGTRVCEGKSDCLILDFAGNIREHGPLDRVDGRRRERSGQGGAAPFKMCPQCAARVFAGSDQCRGCGYVFPPTEIQIEQTAATLPVLSTHATDIWSKVIGTSYSEHRKPGSPPSLKVSYFCGLQTHHEWVCFQHEGYAQQKAAAWWRRRAGVLSPTPRTVAEALQRASELRKPSEIRVQRNGQYLNVTQVRFACYPAS